MRGLVRINVFRTLRAKGMLVLMLALAACGSVRAQYNVNRLITSGEVALHYEDYVLSIQYFNKVLDLKPYLWLPWYDRAVAKYYLDDFVGSEGDATKAIELNPYIEQIFDLRAIDRIRQEKYQDAVDDYNRAIRINPSVASFWLNRAICRVNLDDYDQAILDADTIISKWEKTPQAYSLKAEAYLGKKDTAQADVWLAKSLDVDPYNAEAWTTRAYIALNRKQWRSADTCLSQAIHLKPKVVNNYVNRALARLNINNLSGAMDDYDMAIDLQPDNFLAHYNRGLLRAQLGDDNRAIEDFDFVVSREPQNVMAIYNRALLNDRVGNLRAAIRDYTTIIDQFPNFWAGLSLRATAYRKLGMTARAEADEFRIFKAQMDKHIGQQQRWSKAKLNQVRKRSEIDLSKYNDIVVEDKPTVEHEYKSAIRGAVQNREVNIAFLPMFRPSFFNYSNGIRQGAAYDAELEQFNAKRDPLRKLYLTCNEGGEKLSERQSKEVFQLIDNLTAGIAEETGKEERAALLLQRAVAYAEAQNYADAISDLDDYLATDTASALGRYLRAVCRASLNSYEASRGQNVSMRTSEVEGDFAMALQVAPKNAVIFYDRGNFMAAQKNYSHAIADYTRAIEINPDFAEAYYNRAVALYFSGDTAKALQDLSKAGELGLFDAYALSKRMATQSVDKSKKTAK